MVEIEFDLNQTKTIIHSNLNESFQKVIDKYIQKSSLDPHTVYFISNGNKIIPGKSVESQMNDLNKKNKKMNILVNIIEESDKDKEEMIAMLKEIICPECKEPCKIFFDNYKIKLYDCMNGHINKDIKIPDFKNTQEINNSKIICDDCKFKNKGNSDEFYRCNICKQNLCLLCRAKHNINHNIIKYEEINYICLQHNEPIIKYCKRCHTNICFSCLNHKMHDTIFLGDLIPDMEEIKI